VTPVTGRPLWYLRDMGAGERPLVDVVLPTWCGRRWVFEAIDSVLGQSHERLRLWVVDDASPDATLDAVRERYAGHDPRVTLLPLSTRGGAAAARNAALARGDAPLIAFIDQDDRWRAEKLERQVDCMLGAPEVAVVHSDIVHIDAAGAVRPGAADPDNARRARIDYRALDREALLRECFDAITIRLGAALVRRDAFEAVGGFDTRFPGAEEWSLWVRLAAAGGGVAHLPEPLLERRMHAANTSRVQVAERREGWFRAIDEVAEQHPELAARADRLRASILRSEALTQLRSGRGAAAREPLRRLAALCPGSPQVTGLRALSWTGRAAAPLLALAEALRRRGARRTRAGRIRAA
jgi:glycosyltransferase involved in cell wall biosynthesis